MRTLILALALSALASSAVAQVNFPIVFPVIVIPTPAQPPAPLPITCHSALPAYYCINGGAPIPGSPPPSGKSK